MPLDVNLLTINLGGKDMNYNNFTEAVTDQTSAVRLTAIVGYTLIGCSSIALNIFVIILSLRIPAEQNDYRFFLMNLAIVDCCFAFFAQLVQVHLTYSSFYCKWGSMVHLLFACTEVHALLPVTFNRYVIMCRPNYVYKRIFGSGLKIFFCCLAPYLLSSVTVFLVAILNGFGPDQYNLICNVSGSILTYLPIVGIDFTLTTCFLLFWSVRLWQKTKELATVQSNLQLTEKLKKTKFLLKAFLIQGVSPNILTGPLFLGLFLEPSPVTRWFWAFACLLFTCTGVVDAVATLTVVKPYNTELKLIVRRMLNRNEVEPSSGPTQDSSYRRQPAQKVETRL